jgi:hypothetical protein
VSLILFLKKENSPAFRAGLKLRVLLLDEFVDCQMLIYDQLMA